MSRLYFFNLPQLELFVHFLKTLTGGLVSVQNMPTPESLNKIKNQQIGMETTSTFRLDDSDPQTEKKESSRPCVLPWRLLTIFLQPLRILSSLQPHTHLQRSCEQRGRFCFGLPLRSNASSPLPLNGFYPRARVLPELFFFTHEP